MSGPAILVPAAEMYPTPGLPLSCLADKDISGVPLGIVGYPLQRCAYRRHGEALGED